jgi:uncharacterized membrane protein YgdD (TMEM256/DUF423 family)
MSPRTCVALGSLLGATGVALGAFGAHALHERLEAAGQLANWQTAVSYQLWHAPALVLVGILRERHGGFVWSARAFLAGSLCFSGSIYCLAFGVLRPVMVPLTPLGGVLLLAGWLALASHALRAPRSPPA